MRKFLVLAGALALIAGCSTTPQSISDEDRYKSSFDIPKTLSPRTGETFRRRITEDSRVRDARVTMSGKDQPLMTVLTNAFPALNVNIVPMDNSVDLSKSIDIRADNMPLESFISYVEAVSGYDLDLRSDNTLRVSSFVHRKFNLVPFAGDRSLQTRITTQSSSASGDNEGGSSGISVSSSSSGSQQSGTNSSSGSTATISNREDEWDSILSGARTILGIAEAGGAPGNTNNDPFPSGLNSQQIAGVAATPSGRSPFVTGSRSTGLVMAAGTPPRMRVLEDYLSNAIELATKLIRIDAKMYDVVLNDTVSQGIQWDLLTELTTNSNPLNIATGGGSAFLQGQNIWGLAGSYEGGEVSANLILNFLKQYGRTELINEPSLTIRNGSTAVINAGEQIRFIGGFEQAQDINGNIAQSPNIERVQVGVTLQVTARLLDDDRIMLDIVPVVSSISGGDSFTFNNNSWTIPRTSIQQLSTQVIARSGQPVNLGGLITEKIAKELSGLPFSDGITGQVFKFLFDSERNELEKREMVLIVTPKIVEGV